MRIALTEQISIPSRNAKWPRFPDRERSNRDIVARLVRVLLRLNSIAA
jgi:hypothetical protein